MLQRVLQKVNGPATKGKASTPSTKPGRFRKPAKQAMVVSLGDDAPAVGENELAGYNGSRKVTLKMIWSSVSDRNLS